MDKLTDSELQILREINGDLPPSPWGAWVGACYEALTGGGYITREGITVRGTQALLDAASSTLTADTGDGQSAADTRQIISEGEFRTDNGTSWATDWIGIAQEGFENWKAKPHNARWFRKIDGTPIPNDLTICIGEAFASRLRTLTAENEALRRERNEATSCAACGGPYPNADCGHARNAADVFQPAPCRPDTARAESSEALVAELREKVERLMKALENIYRVGDGYNEHRPEDGKYAGTTGEGHARCREIAHRARTALEGRKDG